MNTAYQCNAYCKFFANIINHVCSNSIYCYFLYLLFYSVDGAITGAGVALRPGCSVSRSVRRK